jgi:hypothetical protein
MISEVFAISFGVVAENCCERYVLPMNYFSDLSFAFSATEKDHLDITSVRKDLKMNIVEFDFESKSSLDSFHFFECIH